MRSSFAVFLRGFTLPFGATTGRRIVFDGVNGTISFYDAANNLFMTLTVTGGIPGMYVFGTDGSQVAMAKVNASGKALFQHFSAGGAQEFTIRDAHILTDTVQAAGGPVGAIVGKLEIFDTAGASLGFIPVYDAIP